MSESKQLNGYELSRTWFDFCFENPELIKPVHSAIYFFAIEHCNRLGWKKKFGFPSAMTMDALGIKSYNTYITALNDLVKFGFIEMVQKSKNQYSANIIALSKYDKALYKALDKAFIKHGSKQSESTVQSTVSINKQDNKEQDNIGQSDLFNDEVKPKDKAKQDIYVNWDTDRLWEEITKSNDNRIKSKGKGYFAEYLQWFYLDMISPTKKGKLKFQERDTFSVGGLLANYATQGYYKGGSPYAE